MSKWYASCVILLRLEKEKEPEGWKQLPVGCIDGISCQHLQSTYDAAVLGGARSTGEITCGMAAKGDPRCTWPAWTSRRPSTWQDQRRMRKIWAIMKFKDGSQRLCYEKWQAWKAMRPSSKMLKAPSLLQDASVNGALKPLGPRRRSQNLQFHVGGQALDPVSLKDALEVHDEGFDRGGGEIAPGTKTSKSVVDKHLC